MRKHIHCALITVNGGGVLSVASINSVVGGSASSNLGLPTTAANGRIALGGNVRNTSLYRHW